MFIEGSLGVASILISPLGEIRKFKTWFRAFEVVGKTELVGVEL